MILDEQVEMAARMMIQHDTSRLCKVGQCPEEIYYLSLKAVHARSRERFQALYMIGTQQVNATAWAKQIGRRYQIVMDWVH